MAQTFAMHRRFGGLLGFTSHTRSVACYRNGGHARHLDLLHFHVLTADKEESVLERLLQTHLHKVS